ncbi:PepSY domain-containing protein [Actinomadura rubrisoli]|uniref:PepSY domain-containing protein n=1 Tax=Actinomadura rubrisoli TaxID=2530368 RepID=A0A4R5B712_9ACTN|nr:PepSY domain-containing protein [Actinomadura rubrisoli]TDD80216.1 hypothetical protein E1298_26240 [Actinomadura rubrisoli]
MRIDARSLLTGRRLLVTAVAATALAGGGAATALAAGNAPDTPGTPTPVTAAQAANAALKAVPGAVEEVELDDDAGRAVWEIDVLARDGGWREVVVDSGTGRLLSDRADSPEEGHAAALRNAKVTASDAAGAALKAVPGEVTSVGFEPRPDKSVWEVDVTSKDGVEHEVTLDASTAQVRANAVDED